MCYIKRKIFPCCGSENWYSEHIQSQCTGTPRCDVDNCIFVGVNPEEIEKGRCWRCLLGDVKRGARLDDRVMREVMRLAERNGYGLDGKKEPKGKGKGKIEVGAKSKEEIGVKRKREMGHEQEREGAEDPRAKKLKGDYGSGRVVYGGGKGKGKGSIIQPRTPEASKSSLQSSVTWTNNQQNPLPVQGSHSYGNQTPELRLRPASQTHPTSNFLQQDSTARGYPSSKLNAGSQQNTTINPALLTTPNDQTPNHQVAWDAAQWDMWLAENSDMAPFLDENLPLEMSTDQEGVMDGHAFNLLATGDAIDLNSILDKKIDNLLALPENMHQSAGQEYVSSFDNFDFQGVHDELNAWLFAEGNTGQTSAPDEQASSSLNNKSYPEQVAAFDQQGASGFSASNSVAQNTLEQAMSASWLPIVQDSGFNQAPSSLSMPGNQNGAFDFEWSSPRSEGMSGQFYKQFPPATSHFGSQKPSSAMDLNIRGGGPHPASIRLGDPMRFQSDLDEQFKKNWPEFVPEDERNADGSDEETKLELEAILFGNTAGKADNAESKAH